MIPVGTNQFYCIGQVVDGQTLDVGFYYYTSTYVGPFGTLAEMEESQRLACVHEEMFGL